MHIILYIHILSATAWVGGSLLLFALGILLRDKEAQKGVYAHLGPIYGYFETFWLTLLWATGLVMFFYFGVDDVMLHAPSSDLARLMSIKLLLVVLLTLFTIIHMVIAFKTHTIERTPLQNLISRSSSIMIFLFNLIILWYAIGIRDLL
jgi:putative copper export protein